MNGAEWVLEPNLVDTAFGATAGCTVYAPWGAFCDERGIAQFSVDRLLVPW